MRSIILISLFFILFSKDILGLTLKMGILAPDGTTWAKYLKEMARLIKEKTKGQVLFKIFYGGVQGDERDVLRKIRIGQLHGGLFTGKTLGEIYGDIRMMEIPFIFDGNEQKARDTLKVLTPYFDRGLKGKGFINLGYLELGQVYFVSQIKTQNLESLKGVKIWAWEGDQIVFVLVDVLGLVSISLPLPDVLSSLSTGIIEAAYAPPLAIIALQWSTKIKYLVDFPLAYSVGSFLLSSRAWQKIPSTYRPIVKKIVGEYVDKINLINVSDNRDSLTWIRSTGVEFLKFPLKDIQRGRTLRKRIIKKLKGTLFSSEGLIKFNKALNR